MNKKRYKKIRAHVSIIAIEWLKGLLNEEEASKITIDNYKTFMPKQSHTFYKRQFKMNLFTERWIKQKIKKVLKKDPTKSISSINMDDLNAS